LLRISMPNAEDIGKSLGGLIHARDDWMGHFSVIESSRIRMRPFVTQLPQS